jgi:alpha-galactosidase
VEPEMVNPDSDLARSHPDWVLSYDGRLPDEWRHQQVLDLANPQAFSYLLERFSALLDDNDIGFLKWDHNRDLIDVRVHGQTIAVYALLDELRRRYPDVEIETCSSGGARIDLGILDRTDRVWGSDTNDALERQQIQRWTSLLIPLELIGSHVGPPVSHTTGRRHTLAFRAVTALFGHFGIEWDIASAGPEERAELAEWVAIAKRHRRLLHSGELVRIDPVDPGLAVHGVVAPDRSEALFAVVAERARSIEQPALVRFAGLDPARSYRVSITSPATASDAASLADIHLQDDPDDLTREIALPGSALMAIGWRAPSMAPETALLVHLAPPP